LTKDQLAQLQTRFDPQQSHSVYAP
jgi:hypothetical protein